jgi:hypothetical protein
MEAPLTAVPGGKVFRPPRADAPLPTPKQSAAPAPRIRPSAPSTRDEPPTPEAHDSPTDQLAEMVAAQRAAAIQPTPGAPSATATMPTPASLRASNLDPLYFRKMVIPILLTFGICFAGWATLILTAGEDSAMPDMFPHWLPIVLFVVGGIFVLLALLNMLAVHKVSRIV